jgi:hypothetical protein
MPQRILVCGGRDFSDRFLLFDVLDNFHGDDPVSAVIEGEAQGADLLARRWAETRKVPIFAFPADWHRYGKKAGPIRNRQMLTEGTPDLVIAFPGGVGTRDMILQAQRARVPIIRVVPRDGMKPDLIPHE